MHFFFVLMNVKTSCGCSFMGASHGTPAAKRTAWAGLLCLLFLPLLRLAHKRIRDDTESWKVSMSKFVMELALS